MTKQNEADKIVVKAFAIATLRDTSVKLAELYGSNIKIEIDVNPKMKSAKIRLSEIIA